ncbi:phage/plasmid primase, P4 family [Selenomonas sp. AB3002]|uniref:phage/plasmid primase, P4 family n=1 Tax=Selenomonas sp. AB3002 TaxID=1392502 RepID=UPI000495B3AF
MKKDDVTMLLRQLKEKGLYRNDGRGLLFRYSTSRGIWVALTPLTGKRYLSMDTAKEAPGLRIGELDELFRELRENVQFTEKGLSEEAYTSLLAVGNGVVDLKTGELQEHNPQMYLRHSLNFNYKAEVTALPPDSAWHNFARTSLGIDSPNADATGKWKSFTEAVVYALSSLPNAKKMIVLIGHANSGKSVVLEFIEDVLGEEAWMPMTFDDMGQRFRGSLMERMQLLVCDELPTRPLKGLDVIKRIISGNPVIIEQKGANPKKYKPRSKIVFAANSLPSLGEPDVGGGFATRLHLIPFTRRGNGNDLELLSKLWAERDVFLSVAVKSMPEFIARGEIFSQVPEADRILQEFKADGFSLETFIKECCVKEEGNWLCLSELYERYLRFCNDNLVRSITRHDLNTSLAQLGYTCQRKRIPDHPNAVVCVQGLKYRQGSSEGSPSDEAAQAKTKVVAMRKEA